MIKQCDFCEYIGEDVEYMQDPYVSELYADDYKEGGEDEGEEIPSNFYCPKCAEDRHDEI